MFNFKQMLANIKMQREKKGNITNMFNMKYQVPEMDGQKAER